MKAKNRREARVPEGRAERIARLGSMVAGIAGEAALEAVRRAAGQGESGPLALTRANARRIGDTLADLRGAAMKLGQLLSLQGEEWLPPALLEVLAALRDHAFVMPEAQVRGVLATELGSGWPELLAEFDFDPIAAASIGQVHAARSADGRDLALKLQYPGVGRSIAADVDNLALLLRMVRILPPELDFEAWAPELKRELAREADYRLEAESTERYQKLVADDPDVLVPSVHRDLSTPRLLATDRILALPIEDLRSPEHPEERRDRIGRALVRLVLRELFSFRFMQTDPNFANYLFEPDQERIVLLDFGAARSFDEPFTETYRGLVIAAVERDEVRLVAAAERLGFLKPGEIRQVRSFCKLCELFAEPLRSPGPYDFASAGIAERIRRLSVEMLAEGGVAQPPTHSLFLHRKLIGSLLLCAHIRATVDCHALYNDLVRTP